MRVIQDISKRFELHTSMERHAMILSRHQSHHIVAFYVLQKQSGKYDRDLSSVDTISHFLNVYRDSPTLPRVFGYCGRTFKPRERTDAGNTATDFAIALKPDSTAQS